MSKVYKLLAYIQQNLKAPKGQWNDFSKYNYRSCEDILSAVKPFLGEATLTLNDEMVLVGDRIYVKSTVTLCLDGEKIENTAFAREADQRKGMNADQLTGATSSYARKYALNGLFAIDDTKDADSMDNRQKEEPLPLPPTFTADQQAAMDGWKVSGKDAAKNDAANGWWLDNKKAIIAECSKTGAKLVHAAVFEK